MKDKANIPAAKNLSVPSSFIFKILSPDISFQRHWGRVNRHHIQQSRLALPDVPITATNSPSSTVTDTPSRRGLHSPLPYIFRKSFVSSIAIDMPSNVFVILV